MQIVIKLSDKIYDTIMDDEMPTNEQMKVIVQRIYEGTPLPKGHGDLVDADAIIAEAIERMKYPENHRYMECVIAHLHLAPIIIEAESEEENEIID